MRFVEWKDEDTTRLFTGLIQLWYILALSERVLRCQDSVFNIEHRAKAIASGECGGTPWNDRTYGSALLVEFPNICYNFCGIPGRFPFHSVISPIKVLKVHKPAEKPPYQGTHWKSVESFKIYFLTSSKLSGHLLLFL